MSHKIKLILTDLNEKLQLDPHNPDLYNNIACLYYRINQIDNAIYHYKRSLSINPDNWQGHFNLANCYVKKNFIPDAIAHYQYSIKLNPHNIYAIQNLGMLLVDGKNFTEALPYLEKSYQLNKENKTNFEFTEQLANCYLQLGNIAKAIEYLKLATNIDGTKESAHHNLAILYLRGKNNKLAAKHFKIAVTLNPKNQTAKHMLSSLNSNTNNQDIESNSKPPHQYVTSLFDQYAPYYNTHVTEKLHYNLPEKLRSLYAKHKTTISAQNTLDLGCGTGLCGIYFRDASVNLIGIDISNNMLLEAAKHRCYDLLIQANLQDNIVFKDNFFNLIIAADVLPYFGQLENLFSNIKNILNNKNNLFLFNIELAHMKHNKKLTISKRVKNIDFSLQPTGRYTHTIDYIEKLAAQFNFKILENITDTIRFQHDSPVTGVIFMLTSY